MAPADLQTLFHFDAQRWHNDLYVCVCVLTASGYHDLYKRATGSNYSGCVNFE